MAVIDWLRDTFNKQRLKQNILQSLPTPTNFRNQVVQPIQRNIVQPAQQNYQAARQQYPTLAKATDIATKYNPAYQAPRLAKDITQGTIAGVGAIGKTLISPNTGAYKAKNKFERALIGDWEIRSLPEALKKNVPALEKYGVPKVGAVPLATLGFVAGTVPFIGGGKIQVAKGIAKTKSVSKISNLLKTTDIDEKVIPKLANKLANVKDSKKVQSAIEETQKLFPKLKPGEVGGGAKKPVSLLNKEEIAPSTQAIGPQAGQSDILPTTVSGIVPKTQKQILIGLPKNVSFEPTITPKILKVKTTKKYAELLPKQIKVKIKNLADVDPESVKDITGFDASFKSVYRNLSKAFGKNFENVKRRVLDPFDSSKGVWVDDQANWANKLKTEIVDGLKIRKGSKESALVQRWGEKRITLEELKQQTPKWREIVEADTWFRKQYDQLLDEVNTVRKQIYPNRPDKLIPRRQDYYRHFQELEGAEGMKNLFETPSNIPTELAGISDYTEPKSRFLSFAQKRLGGGFKEDAVGGFIDYIRAQTYAKHIDPHISKFRGLADELRGMAKTGDERTGSRLVEYLEDFANDLAGKTNPLDRSVQKVTGRKFFRAIDWVNRRVKLNVILGNLSSAVAQFGNVPQAMAHAGYKNWTVGFIDTLRGVGKTDKVIAQSPFIKERYFNAFNQFDSGIAKSTKRMAAWITRALDELGTKASWNGFYRQALEQKIPNPIRYADDLTRQMVAGRGVGEVALAQKSKTLQLVAPFQVEVQNLWHVLGKDIGEKKFGTLLKFAIAAYGFNQVAERLRGSGVTLDPIQAVADAYTTYSEEEDKKIGGLRAGGRLAGEVLSNMIGGQTLAGMYPEYGITIGGQTLTRKELFGDEDPTRFGSGLLASGAVQDPLYKLLPGFGGQQIKRTLQGLGTVAQGYAETAKGKVQTPVGQDLINWLKGATFGKSSLREMQDFYKSGQTALGEKQSVEFKEKGQSVYEQVMKDRFINDQKQAVKDNTKKNRPEEVSPGVFRLANDKLYTKIGDEYRTLDNKDELQIELYKQEIRDGKRTGFTYNGVVYYQAKDGSIRKKTATTAKKSTSGGGGGKAKTTKLSTTFRKASIKTVSVPTTTIKGPSSQTIGGQFAKLKLAGGKRATRKSPGRKGLTIREMV